MGKEKTKRGWLARVLRKGIFTTFMLAVAAFAILQWQDDGPASTQRDETNAQQASPNGAVEVGAPAPDFELTGVDGESVKLSDFRGRPVVVTFMHTW
jgi:cytochrome oxidase Cu insertion factor (SCO1/SenC/PrrC family)